MNRSVRVAGVVMMLAGASLGGCNNRMNELEENNRALTDRNQALQGEIETLRAAGADLQAAVDSRDRALAEMRALSGELQDENSRLQDELGRLGGRLENIKFGRLDEATDRALRDLASQYPDLVMYDADRGMVRFTSDLTFASGSTQVTDQGRRSLDALAKILASGPAMAYDVRIVGHTDSQRISRAETRQHSPTNWHLSVNRSIAVMDELAKMGVGAERIEVAGRGEFQPVVANAGRGNTPQNRRVEIYLVRPSGPRTPAPAARDEGPAAPAPTPARREEDMVK
ncbi:MAG TPA: OmpA family protein [Phycisphaerales bacterium]|nr:OmpA family protein [Phycisphaerales bacterium]